MLDSSVIVFFVCFFFFQAEDGIRDSSVTGVQTCALPIYVPEPARRETPLTARIEMLGVSKAFPGVRALEHVDFSVQSGEVHALMGENEIGRASCRERV